MIIGAIIVISILMISAILLLLWPKIYLFIEKRHYKSLVTRNVYSIAKDYDYYLINKVAIPIEDGKKIHFDHILFTEKYIYCIGDAYYDGPLSGKYPDAQWFKYNSLNQFTHVKNPMSLHHVRLNYLKGETTASDDLFVGIIVVNDSCFLDNIPGKPQSEFICRENELRSVILKKEKDNVPIIDPLQLDALVHNIYKKNVSD